jgi:hypothetical protein
MTPLRIEGYCVCGGSTEEPSADCERCRLVEVVRSLAFCLYDYRRRRIDDDLAVSTMAEEFELDFEELAKLCGRRP